MYIGLHVNTRPMESGVRSPPHDEKRLAKFAFPVSPTWLSCSVIYMCISLLSRLGGVSAHAVNSSLSTPFLPYGGARDFAYQALPHPKFARVQRSLCAHEGRAWGRG